jgi:hypothetical protein
MPLFFHFFCTDWSFKQQIMISSSTSSCSSIPLDDLRASLKALGP